MPTGQGIRVAIVDSGVFADHPHVGGVSGGIAIGPDGVEQADFVDRLGHGTAVAAAIREKAPDAELYAVRIFDRTLSANAAQLAAAIAWAAHSGMHLVNLSLGTTRDAHEVALRAAVDRAASMGTLVVSARRDHPSSSLRWLPGDLDGVIAVDVDWTIPRERYRIVEDGGRRTLVASGFPRDIPGVPREKNLHGVSFAVANATGFAALALESIAPECSLAALLTALQAREL